MLVWAIPSAYCLVMMAPQLSSTRTITFPAKKALRVMNSKADLFKRSMPRLLASARIELSCRQHLRASCKPSCFASGSALWRKVVGVGVSFRGTNPRKRVGLSLMRFLEAVGSLFEIAWNLSMCDFSRSRRPPARPWHTRTRPPRTTPDHAMDGDYSGSERSL